LAGFAKAALAQDFTGAVYARTNAQQNGLVAYGRNADGTLAYIGEYLSGGAGGRLNDGGAGDPLISQHSVLNVGNRFVLQVNAGSNTVSSFRVNKDFSLTLISVVPSAGLDRTPLSAVGSSMLPMSTAMAFIPDRRTR
jgi:hypothetical protein